MTFETDFKVNDSLTTDRTVPNMQRLRTISMDKRKTSYSRKKAPTEEMFRLGQRSVSQRSVMVIVEVVDYE